MTSSSTHQDAKLAPAVKMEDKSRTGRFIEGPMLDEPSLPPPTHFLGKSPSTRSSSESKNTDSQTEGLTQKHPTRSVSEPLESSSPKPTEKPLKT